MPASAIIRRWMRVLSPVLGCGALGFSVLLSESIIKHLSVGVTAVLFDGDETRGRSPSLVERTQPGGRSPLPALSEFQIVVERHPFKSPREVATPVVVKPAPVPVVPMIPKVPVSRPPLPSLSVTLSGTVAIGDERMAILKDGTREDLYVIGQPVAGGVIEKIDGDRVVITRAGERTELLMKSAAEGAGAQLAAMGRAFSEKNGEVKVNSTESAFPNSEDKKKKILPSNKLLYTTPAFARYPGVTYGGGKQ